MRSPALAIAGSVWWRHRWGFIAAGATMLATGIAYPFLFSWNRDPVVVVLSLLPFVPVFGFVLRSVLLVEEAGSMSSSYPRSMFVLPVPTRTLVFWPMLYASLAAALCWLATAVLVYRPSGFVLPLFLPALAFAAAMAWVTALSWLPISIPWVRLAPALGSVLGMGALPLWLIENGLVGHVFLTLLLLSYLAAAFLLGCAAVSSARRGDVLLVWPEVRRFGPLERPTRRPSIKRPFRSPAAAQFWFEWKCHGLNLPVVVGVLLVVIVLMTLHAGSRNNEFVLPLMLGTFLGMPIIQAGSAGIGSGRFTPIVVKTPAFITFSATRPMRSGDLVAAKLRMVLANVLVTWLVTLAALGLWIVASGNTGNVARLARSYNARHGAGEVLELFLLAAVLLPAWTWKHASDDLALSITGRRWLEGVCAFITTGTILALIAAVLRFMLHPEELAWFLSILPWVVISAAVAKGLVAIASYSVALGRRLIAWSSLWKALAAWFAFACGALAMVQLIVPGGMVPVSRPILFLGMATLAPLARYPLATLALEWNRHR
jgi:hypothetical protein